MINGQDVEIKIIDDQINPTGRPSLIDRWRNFITSRQIKISKQPALEEKEESSNLGRIVEDEKARGLTISITPQQAELLYLNEATNRLSAQDFISSLRIETPEILGDNAQRKDYQTGDYGAIDMVRLADRWLMPVVFIRKGPIPSQVGNQHVGLDGGHWVLALTAPEERDGEWGVDIYDPLTGGEERHVLRDWKGFNDGESQRQNNFYLSKLGFEALRDGQYNLSLASDYKILEHGQLSRAKQTRVQFDATNCGPLVLYMAALRNGVREGNNTFKFMGRDRMKKDTGLKVLIREELLES